MCKKLKLQFSLKKQLLVYFIIEGLIIGISLGLYYYSSLNTGLVRNIGESQYTIVTEMMNNIDKQVEQVNNLLNWLSVNNDIIGFLKQSQTDAGNLADRRKKALESVADRLSFLPIDYYISALYVIGNDEREIKKGINAYYIPFERFSNDEWYKKSVQKKGEVLWWPAISNYSLIPTELEKSNMQFIIPLFKSIIDIEDNSKIGNIVFFFSTDIFFDITDIKLQNSKEVINLTDKDFNIILSSNISQFGLDLSLNSYCNKLSGSNNYFVHNENNRKKLIVYKKSEYTGWYLVKELPLDIIEKESNKIKLVVAIVFLATSVFTFILSMFLSENFTKPIREIINQVNEIAKGKFTNLNGVDNRNEIGMLRASIQKMQIDLEEYTNSIIRKDAEKRELEIKMLQSQINPHFLYNTLNSVKIMAALQGAESICEMISSLGELVEAAVKNQDEKIPISEELNIIQNYINIQRIRYKGKIIFNIICENNSIKEYSIVRFVLQPIIENAIFHGLEPKNGTGRIEITLKEVNEYVYITIWDDGVGISEDKVKELLEHPNKYDRKKSFRRIGLENVNRRIKLIFGEEYGLLIESSIEHYTKVILKIPAEKYKEQGGECNESLDS